MKSSFTFSHFKLFLSVLLLTAFYAANATYVPVIIPTSGLGGFNADVVADSAPPVQQPPYLPGQNWATMRTTATFDASTHYLVATGFKRDTFTSNPFVLPALPTNRVILSNTMQAAPQLFWNLAPYNGNNSIRMTLAQTVTITVNPATYIGDVYILGASTGGATTVNITVTFVGGTTQVLNGQSFADWIGGNPYEALAIGRVIKATALGDQTLAGSNPRLYMVKVPITNANLSKQIASITITRLSSTTVLNILAITIDDQSACLPVINNPTVQPNSVGLTEGKFIFTPPTSTAAGFVTPQNYQWVVSPNAIPPNPVVGGNSFTLSGPGPNDTVHATGLPNLPTAPQYFHIRTDCGNGSYSIWRTVPFTTLLCSQPGTPTQVAGSLNMTGVTLNVGIPAQPTPPTGSGLINHTVAYEWTLDNTATAPTGAGQNFVAFTNPPTSIQLPFTGLIANTQYYLHIRKQCTFGNTWSAWTNYSFTTLACPNSSMLPSVTNLTTVSARLKWRVPGLSSNPHSGYEVAVTTSATPPASGTFYGVLPGPPGTQVYDTLVTGLIPQTPYWFHLRNVCSGGYYSNWISTPFPQTQNCPNATSIPTIVTNVPGAMTFKWNGTTVPGHYEYHYALQLAAAPAPTTWVATFDTFAVLPNATYPVYPGVFYKFWVRGNCTITNAPWLSSTPTTGIQNPFPPCLIPTNLTITNVNMHGAALNWTSGLNGIGYQYLVTTNPNPPANGSYTTDTFHNATNLLSNTKYYVHLRTHCNTTPVGPTLYNYSPWIKDSFITTSTCLTPVPPSITNVTSSSAQIMWNFFPGLYSYEFLLNTDPTTPTISGQAINYNGNYPINLSSGTTYYVHLRTRCDTFNYSPWIIASFTTDKVCPITGPVPAVNYVTDKTAMFNWSPVSGAVKYETALTSSSVPPVGGSNFTTVTKDTAYNLNPNTSYWFHLRAFCSDSDITDWQSISWKTWPTAVGNINGNNAFDMQVHPNPVYDVLNVDITGMSGSSGRMQLVDMNGSIVETITVTGNKTVINTSKLAAGMYLLKYVDSENAGVIRVEKQ